MHYISAQALDLLLDVIGSVRKLKTAQQLSLKTPLESLTIYGTNAETLKLLVPQEALLRGVTQAQMVVYETGQLAENVLEKQGDLLVMKVKISEIKSNKSGPLSGCKNTFHEMQP